MKGNLRRLLAIFLVLVMLSTDVCAFADAVATLTLPSALQIIDEEAFYGNTSIEKVIVPDGTTEIRSKAFADSSMTELVLPDSLSFIADDAFAGCNKLKKVTATAGTPGYDWAVNHGFIAPSEEFVCTIGEGEITITGYKGNDTSVTIPSQIGMYPVTAIGKNAFAHSSVRDVNLTGMLENIHESAFSGCVDLHLFGADGIYAQQWAKDNAVPYNIDWMDAPFLTVFQNGSGINLAWNVSEAADQYVIYEVLDGTLSQMTTVGAVDAYAISSVPDGEHNYAVMPVKTINGKTVNGFVSNYVVFANAMWKTVSDVTATVSDKSVTLTWSTKELAEGYQISEMILNTKQAIGTAGAVTYYEINNAATGDHTYVVEPFKTENGTKSFGMAAQTKATVARTMVKNITLNRSYLELEADEIYTLSAAVSPSYADTKNVAWHSDNPDVATVSAGVVKAISSGTATITAMAQDGSGVAASCIVEVSIEAPYLTVVHPIIGDVLNAGDIEMHNGSAHQTWTLDSNYPSRVEKVGDWFELSAASFDAGENTLILSMADGTPAGTKRTGKVKFYINNSLFVEVNIYQDGGERDPVIIDPSISVNHPVLGDIFDAGTFEMWNGSAHQTWTVTANCDWTITKSGSWFTVDRTSGSAGTSTIILTMTDGVAAGKTRSGSITFKVNGSTYKTVNFKQVGPEKALTVTHELLGDIIAASPIEMHNGSAHQTWTITSNADWTLSTTGTWYSVSKTSGSAGTTTLVLTFPDGADPGDSRTGKLKFYFDGTLYTTITITQDGGADMEPSASISVVHPWIGDVIDVGEAYLANSHGQSMNWTVFANYDWKITTTGSWFTVSPTSGSANTKTTVKITTTDYAPSGYNSGSIVFKKGSSKKATIKLYQGEGYDPGEYEDSFTVNHPDLGNVLDQDTIYMHNGSAHQTWSVVSNVDWSLTKSGSWFSVSPTSGAARTSTDVVLTFPDGVDAGDSREGYVKFTYYINGKKKTATVYIAQDGGPAEPEPEVSLAASHALLGDVFQASPIEMHNGIGAEQNWTITSNENWRITTSGSWFSVSPTSGSANTASNKSTNVKITMTDYARAGNKNTGTITFYVDGVKYKTVSLFQDGGEASAPSMTVGSADFGDVLTLDTIPLKNEKKTYDFIVKANRAWSVTKSGSWFTITPASGNADTQYTFKVTVNTLPAQGQELTGSLTFKVDGTTYKTVGLKIAASGSVVVDPDDSKLPAPTNVTAVVTGQTSAKLTWNNVSGASGFNVYRGTTVTGTYTKLNSNLVTSCTFTDTTLTSGVNYYYYVTAVSSSNVIGSGSTPVGPVSYNAACTLSTGAVAWTPAATGASKSFTISKHGSNDYTVSIVQYNSAGTLCTGNTTSTDHTLANWLTCTKSGTTLTLTAAKNYAATGKTAIVNIKCGCGATHSITVNQNSGEKAPASVSMRLDGYNGFTESSTVRGAATVSHLDYVLAPGDTMTVAAAGGNYARRLTVRIINSNGKTVLDQSSTATGTSGLSKSYSYTIPDGATGIYTIYVYASNSTTAGDDAQWINTSASIRVRDGSNNHTSINYPYDKKDFSDEIWSTLTEEWNLSAVHAAAIMGNIDAESGYCPYNSQSYAGVDDRTKYAFATNDGVGFGLCQWTSSGRKAGLLSYAINKGSADMVWDFDIQMGYLNSELNLTKLQSYNSLYEATEWFDIWFERPSQGAANSWPGTRYAKALNAYKKYVGSVYSEPALIFSVKQNGTNVTSGLKLTDNASVYSAATLVVSSNYYWRLSQESSTVSDWLSITCPRLYYPNQTVNCECGYAGNTTLTLKVNKVPTNGQTYSTTLVFEIYQNNHVSKRIPITLTCTGSQTGGQTQPETLIPQGITFSDSYKNGIYYTRLIETLNTSKDLPTNERIVAVALSQKGYVPGSSSSELSGEGSGVYQYTEYGRYTGANNADWCASFVSWCAAVTGVSESVLPKTAGAGTFRSYGTPYWIWGKDFSATIPLVSYVPQKGDIVLFTPYKAWSDGCSIRSDANGKILGTNNHDDHKQYKTSSTYMNYYNASSPSSHVAIVYDFSYSDGVYSLSIIEGNSGNKCGTRTLKINTKYSKEKTSNEAMGENGQAYVIQMITRPNY